MASGRVGGTRSKISGVVGGDVYTIRKESNGSYQQVVAPLPESRPDTLTPAKVIERILMSIVYKYMQAIPAILTEAFGDTLTKSLNLQDFVRQNIRRLRERMEQQEWPRGPIYFYDYGDPYFYPAPLIVSQGKAPLPLTSGEMVFEVEGVWTFTANLARYHQGITVRQWMKDNKMSVGDILVPMVMVVDDIPAFNRLLFERYVFAPAVDLDTVITTELFPTLWDAPENPKIKLKCRLFGAENLLNPYFELTQADAGGQRACAGYALIKSGIVNGVWERSTSYVSTFKQTGSKASLVNTLEDVWDSWYTDRISPEPEPEPEPPTPSPRLPEEYQEVEYVFAKYSDQLEFIQDFDIKKHILWIDFDPIENQRIRLFYSNTKKGALMINSGPNNEQINYLFRYYVANSTTSTLVQYGNYPNQRTKISYGVKNGMLTAEISDRESQSVDASEFLVDEKFSYKLGYTGAYKLYGKVYEFKVLDNSTDEAIKDFIPCYRKADNLCGFYDIINDIFITASDAATTYEAGPDVNY